VPWPFQGLARVVWGGKGKKTALTEAVGCTLAGSREGKMEFLVESGGKG